MQSIFLGKASSKWLLKGIEEFVMEKTKKQFIAFREGDSTYTLNRISKLMVSF